MKSAIHEIDDVADVPRARRTVIARLAEEGVPTRAIARAFQMPCDIVYDVLREEVTAAHLLEMPRDDWPVGQGRNERSGSGRMAQVDDEDVIMELMRVFQISKQQAILLNVLLKKKTATKDALYSAAQAVHAIGQDTEPKIVDVVICKLRKKLSAHNFKIETIWGGGYYMSTEDRSAALRMIGLEAFTDTSEAPPAAEPTEAVA